MFYKNCPYWLKGGLLSIFIVILVVSFYIFIWVPIFTDNMLVLLILIPGLYILSPFGDCISFMGPVGKCLISSETYSILLILATLMGYFIVGAIVGFIYGKIKNDFMQKITKFILIILSILFLCIVLFGGGIFIYKKYSAIKYIENMNDKGVVIQTSENAVSINLAEQKIIGKSGREIIVDNKTIIKCNENNCSLNNICLSGNKNTDGNCYGLESYVIVSYVQKNKLYYATEVLLVSK